VPPADIVLPCGVDVSPAGIAAFYDDPTTVDRDTDDNRIDPDELDVDLVVENNEGIRWAYPHYYAEGVGSGGPHAQAVNNEVCNLITGYTDSDIDACAEGCNGNRKVLRDWVVLDWCSGQFINYSQIIKSLDENPPFLSLNDTSASVDPWECTATVHLPHPEHMGDDCDDNITYYIGNRNGFDLSGNAEDGFVLHNVPLGSWTVEYRSEDCCGNVGSATMTVTVVDNTPPVAVSKEFIVLSLTNIANQVDEFQGTAKLFAEDVDNGSYDGCTGVSFAIRRTPVCDASDADWGPSVKFCCEDLNGGTQANIDVELRIMDENGNENIVWATVLLEDKSATVPQLPPHMFLTCDMDYNNLEMTGGIPRYFGACGEAQIECDTAEVYENTEPRELRASDGVIIDGVGPIEAPAYDPSCGFGAIRRQFRDCGGGNQWFVILPVDPFDPSTIVWPDDVSVDCDDYDVGEPYWEEATCNLVGVSLEADTFLFEDGACYKILNHWSVINWCVYDPTNPAAGGKYEYTQTIKIIDTVDPVVTVADSLCFAVTGECVSADVSMSGSATDDGDCGSEWISWDVSIDAYADWTEDFHYATSNPAVLPNGDPNPYHIAKTGNGEDATITLPDGIPSSGIWHRAVWRAYDGCGNTSSVTRYFQIIDKKAPTPYCLNLSTAVMSNGEVELWAIDFNVGSFDNCTDSDNLLFTFTDVAPPPRDDTEYDSNSDLMWYNGTFWFYDSTNGDYEKIDDYGGDTHRWEPGLRSASKVFKSEDADSVGIITVPIFVWDETGNNDFCLVNIRLVNNNSSNSSELSGHIATEQKQPVENLTTQITSDLPGFPKFGASDKEGDYAFNSLITNSDYSIVAYSNEDYLNGVSTLDLVLIQRHILGLQYLDSPYKMIAADVNNDNQITALDLIELRKLILGIYKELPETNSWISVDSNQKLSLDNPWAYNRSLNFENLADDYDEADLIALKIGDVNNSAITTLDQKRPEAVSLNVIDLIYDDKHIGAGEVIDLQLYSNSSELVAYQLTLAIPGFEPLNIDGAGFNEGNLGIMSDRLTLSCNERFALGVGTILTLQLKALVSQKVGDKIQINSDITKAEAYLGEELKVIDISTSSSLEKEQYNLLQNSPNPFKDKTTISYTLPANELVKMEFFDVSGKLLYIIKLNGQKGINNFELNASKLNTNNSIIYYALTTDKFTATKKMLILK